MKVLVTGATGFVGSHLTDLLHSEGHQVNSLVRNPKKAHDFKTKGKLITGNLNPTGGNEWIDKLPSDLDAVVHIAGVVHSFSISEFYKINTEATRQLTSDLKKRFSELKFIFVSSLAAAGPCENYQTELDTPIPISEYGNSKLEAEKFLLDKSLDSWKRIIIRPPMVIGPRDPAILDVFKMVKKGIVPSIGSNSGEKVYSFVAVYDLIQTIKLTLESTSIKDETFYSSFPKAIIFKDLLKVISKEMEVKDSKIIALPLPIAKLAATLLSFIKPKNVRLTPDKIKEITPVAWTCSAEKSSRILKQEYHWDIERIIKSTFQDYKDRNWI